MAEEEERDSKVYYLERDLEKEHIEVGNLSYLNYKLKRQNVILTVLFIGSIVLNFLGWFVY